MYSDVAPDNASWLASNGQYNAKTVYPDYYDWLVEQMNAGVDGFKGTTAYQFKGNTAETEAYVPSFSTRNPVVGSAIYGGTPIQVLGHATQVNADGSVIVQDVVNNITVTLVFKQEIPNIPWFTDYDFAINTADQTFRLPLIAGRILVAKKEATTEDQRWYNLYSDGWLEQGGVVANTGANHVATISLLKPYANTNYIVTIGYENSAGAVAVADIGQIGTKTTSSFQSYQYHDIIINWQACGYAEVPTQSDFTEVSGLYYYVGDTVQDASLINAGAVLGQLANVNAASRGYVVESYHNGTEWYRIYSDGWIEQGGRFYNNADVENTISFLKPFKNTDYSLLINHGVSGKYEIGLSGKHSDEAWGYTTTNFQAQTYNAVGLNWIVWSACGY